MPGCIYGRTRGRSFIVVLTQSDRHWRLDWLGRSRPRRDARAQIIGRSACGVLPFE